MAALDAQQDANNNQEQRDACCVKRCAQIRPSAGSTAYFWHLCTHANIYCNCCRDVNRDHKTGGIYVFCLVICNTEQGRCWIEGSRWWDIIGAMCLEHVRCIIRHKTCVKSYTISHNWKSGPLQYQIRADSKQENEWPTFCPTQLCNEATLSKFTTTHWVAFPFLVILIFKLLKKDENAKNMLREGKCFFLFFFTSAHLSLCLSMSAFSYFLPLSISETQT